MASVRITMIAGVAALATICGLPHIATAQIAFTDVSVEAGVADAGESYGASWGDLNGDGYPDIFASNHRQRNSLYLNLGNGTFADTGAQVLSWRNRSRADTHGASWSDFDNDGDQDLLVSTGVGNLNQLLVNENGRLIDRAVERGLTMVDIGGRLPVWYDFDGDRLPDFVMAQYAGIARLFKQNPGGTFTEATSGARLVCTRFHYGQLIDVTADFHLDFLCSDEKLFPQKIYYTLTPAWQTIFNNANPSPLLPFVPKVADSVLADFNNDGRMDMFVLGGVQLRPTSVDRSSGSSFEAQLSGGNKGVRFVSAGVVTLTLDWNKRDEEAQTDLSKIKMGAGGRSPESLPIILDPADARLHGMPPAPAVSTDLPAFHIGYDPALQQWTMGLKTKLTPSSPNIFSEAYMRVSSTAHISKLNATGRWPSDKAARPTLLLNLPTGFVDQTVAAGLDTPVQCVSATAGDFDNDMDIDIYLACRSGASNLPNILYQNLGGGTYQAVPDAGGAAGQVGVAFATGAGTADTVVSADYNLDGFLDLFVTNGFNLRPLQFGGENKLFRNAGNANHWVQVDLVGTNSDRDAVGARVYATANGIGQMRIQNGGYHRWAQDYKRSHFGLGSATTVDLLVAWPSGAVESYPGVAPNHLYRITEGSGIAQVTAGVAPAYSCGAPTLNGAVDSGIFVWRDCPSGEWRLKTVAAGGQVTFAGSVSSSAGFTSVKAMSLDATDVLDSTNPNQFAFTFDTTGTGTDGVNFLTPAGSSTCLKVSAPPGTPVYYGPFRAALTPPFNLETQVTCN